MKREITEVCPHCDKENTFLWDVKKQSYTSTCEHCGKKLMLCDECLHSEDNRTQICDWHETKDGKGFCFREEERLKMILNQFVAKKFPEKVYAQVTFKEDISESFYFNDSFELYKFLSKYFPENFAKEAKEWTESSSVGDFFEKNDVEIEMMKED